MKRGARGFTLIELLAAIAIFAVMALMAYGGLSAVLKARVAIETSLSRTAEIQKAIYRLQSDFELARARPIRDEYGDLQPAFVSREEGRDDARIEFTRGGRRNPSLQRRSALERVAYGLKDGKLIRYHWTTLDRAQDDSLLEIPLLNSVESISWRFLDAQRAWQSSWPPRNTLNTEGQAERLPLAVELTIETQDWGEIRYLFRIVASTPPSAADLSPPSGDDKKDDDKPPAPPPNPGVTPEGGNT
jgi:general secretion pathway protein J